MIIGCIDKETEIRHLKETPLKEGWIRFYNDHTGRWFEDYSPEEWERMNEPNEASILMEKLLTEAINNEIINRIKDGK